MGKFPLCFWNYATFDQMGDNPVKDWIDAGFSMALSPVFRNGVDKPERMVKLLDECAAAGISVIIDDARCKWNGVEDEAAYRADFKQMLEEYGNHPAVYGFYVGDEPMADKLAAAIKAVKIQKELAPQKEPFINFNPYYDGNENVLGCENFDTWAHNFVSESGLKQFSYDCYAQMNPDDASHSGVNNYFDNLRRYGIASRRENIPFWVTDLAVPHFNYRTPTVEDFTWQLNTSVACGAKSVWWFFLYLRYPRINYRLAPIDEYGKRTEAYFRLAQAQNIFQHQFGELFNNLIYDEAYHTGLSFGGFPLFMYRTHKYLKRVVAEHQVPGVVSFFHTEGGDKYMVFVNNNTVESDLFKFTFTKNVKALYRVCYGLSPENTIASSKDEQYSIIRTANGSYEADCLRNDNANFCRITEGELYNEARLAPGQMEIYRIITEE